MRRGKGSSIYRRGRSYWLDATVNGERFRVSLRVTKWNEAQQATRQKIVGIEAGRITSRATPFAKRGFDAACDAHIEERAIRVSPRTVRTDREHSKHLREFFGDRAVHRITPDHVREYLALRKAAKASGRTVNMELGILRRILARANRPHLFLVPACSNR